MTGTIMTESRLDTATELARRAGKLALAYFENREELLVRQKRHVTDLVSQADLEVETLIRDGLNRSFPLDAQLGEEHGPL